ncbi:hypothetical protein [uncultured Parabacteroides sp.]|uniref:hypothetical protein n=1 Tax=uncultured Parabacteroides sp. TaxID=512312 RepID=UPI0026F3036A|nr:hypothetical protein [uncultured Parabacteroides sp.]
MRRLLLLTTLIGLLFIAPGGFAQSHKPKRATIKYKHGAKYVGEINKRPKKYIQDPLFQLFIGKDKVKHGKGVMYFANGDQLDGWWVDDQCRYGTYKFADGNIFVGKINNSKMLHDGSMSFSSDRGTMTFASEGEIVRGDKKWHYPAGCRFSGTIKDKNRLCTGTFDCTLINEEGDRYMGKFSEKHLDNGRIEYANGDTFEGNFMSDAPSSGKYCYGEPTEIVKADCKWKIPAGCVFEGNIATFTGSVNMEIIDSVGNKFVGKLNTGEPDEGTMTLANGATETGKWQDGMSPSAYKAYLVEQEAQRAKERQIYDRKCLSAFESYINNHIAQEREKNIWNTCFKSIVCGNYWNRDNKELVHGASIKLAQLYVGKQVTYSKTGKKIYVCTAINHEASAPYIEMILEPEQGGATKTLYLTKVRISKSPELSSLLPINYPYPNTLPHVYYRCEAIESKGSEGSFYDNLICLVSDDEQNASAQAKNYWTRRFGENFGEAVFNRKAKLGMTVEMVQVIEKSEGRMRRHVEQGRKIIVLTYGGDYNIFFENFSKRRTYRFVNNRLTEFTE